MDNYGRTPEQMFVSEIMVAAIRASGALPPAEELKSYMEDAIEAWCAHYPRDEVIEAFNELAVEVPAPALPSTTVPVDDGGSRGLMPIGGPAKLTIPPRPDGLPPMAKAGKFDRDNKWLNARIGMGKKDCEMWSRPWKEVTWAMALQFVPGTHDDHIGYIKFLTGLDPDSEFKQMTIARANEVFDRLGRTADTPF